MKEGDLCLWGLRRCQSRDPDKRVSNQPTNAQTVGLLEMYRPVIDKAWTVRESA
jgi:hypothetical protein